METRMKAALESEDDYRHKIEECEELIRQIKTEIKKQKMLKQADKLK
jgi:hypothetical protein